MYENNMSRVSNLEFRNLQGTLHAKPSYDASVWALQA